MIGNLPEPENDGPVALVNGRIVLPKEIVTGKALLLEGVKIAAIAATGEIGVDTRRIDVQGRLIAPGLIDIHTHGERGYHLDAA